MKKAVISIGTNLGNRRENIKIATEWLEHTIGKVTKSSQIRETASWGFDSHPFLNQVLIIETELEPHRLLAELKSIEKKMGRTEKTHLDEQGNPVYSDRIIDLDILLYDNQTIQLPDLTIPHSQLTQRDFVLEPLEELFGETVVAPFTKPFSQYRENKINMNIQYDYVVIEGCIGAGKTTLSTKLATDLNANLILERFADNSFLPKFYEDPVHYAFPLEMSFLSDRYQQLKNFQRDIFKSNLVIADYFVNKCIIFSKNNLQDDEYALYMKISNIIFDALPKPDLLIYLYNDVDRLLQNISSRGRDYERNISPEYLTNIQEGYMNHLQHYNADTPILIVEAHDLDFVKRPEDYDKLKSLLYKKYPKGITTISKF
ncbi:MAG: 2-amino-4-hydroxy-6-hydroxymethyldihydropteridine diphosphokinase [Bacteroidales bacterium]|nr:2-amino-4-hydroxy-6-hydroxymethyldihydropteridine diphosphokinase [Bacteroidales bacterium]